MKKAWSIILILTLFAVAPILAGASDYGTNPVDGKTIPQLKMTDDQKAKMISLKIQVLELKKQIIKQNIDNGSITKEQAKMMEDKINARLKALQSGELGHPHRNHSPKCKIQQ